jgi:hypothetical protein
MALPAPDLILTNGRVITLDPLQPHARTVTIGASRILSLSNEDLRGKNAPGACVIDCRGRTVLPGFIDAHCHLAAYAQSLVTLSLQPRSNVRSLSDIQKAIRRLSLTLPPGAWIRGRGYDEFHLKEKRHPTRRDLDQAAGDHPVKISHRSGQAHVLNSLALSLAGISGTTPDPPDGLTGLLYGMGGFLSGKVPPLADDEYARGIRQANANLLAAGITSLQDATAQNGVEEWRMFERWKREGLLKPRVRMMAGFAALNAWERGEFKSSLSEQELATGGIKIKISETTGRLLPERNDLREMVLQIHRLGLQAVLHAIEEIAIEAACAAIAYAVNKYPRPDHRHRVEHCSVCPPALAGRLSSLGVMVATQPSFIYCHGERYLQTVSPEQFAHLYPLATLLGKGVTVAGSSDFPLAPPDPLLGIYAAVTRRAETGETLLTQEGITKEQALGLFTQNGARSAFEEQEKGSLTPGKLADLVVLSGDPTAVRAEEIKDIKVMMTIINGKVVWRREHQ